MNKYMQLALNKAKLSCDPNTQVGCVIVKDNEVLSFGYNTLPCGLHYHEYPLDVRNGDYFLTKYPYMIHAEAKAISNAKTCLESSTLYVTLFPCHECAKLIIESKILKVIYYSDKYAKEQSTIASKKMLNGANIVFEKCSI